MATAQSLPVPPAAPQPAPATPANSTAIEQVPPPAPPEREDEADPTQFKGPVARLPVELEVAIPVRDFRVRNLLALAEGQVIESQWANGEDMPLAADEVQLAWTEFEVIETQLAVRVTHLA